MTAVDTAVNILDIMLDVARRPSKQTADERMRQRLLALPRPNIVAIQIGHMFNVGLPKVRLRVFELLGVKP